MSVLEIVLLLIGGVIFVLSFVIPVQKEEVSDETKNLAKKEIENLVAKEMENIKDHVDDVVEEAIEYSMEKTERSLERLSNEKIMAVSDYSDTVLKEIHKNHEEAIFLYDMLNDKHTNLKNTVTEVNRTVKEAAKLIPNEGTGKGVAETPVEMSVPEKKKASAKEKSKPVESIVIETAQSLNNAHTVDVADNVETAMDISFAAGTDDAGRNCNERILELHKKGKSKVAIAKELGLGVGEVKLVIDLYQNM